GFALGDHAGDLPVLVAIEHDKEIAIARHPVSTQWVGGKAREAEPKNVHGRAQALRLQASGRTQQRMPSIASHDKIGIEPDHTLCRPGHYAGNPSIGATHELRYFVAHT